MDMAKTAWLNAQRRRALVWAGLRPGADTAGRPNDRRVPWSNPVKAFLLLLPLWTVPLWLLFTLGLSPKYGIEEGPWFAGLTMIIAMRGNGRNGSAVRHRVGAVAAGYLTPFVLVIAPVLLFPHADHHRPGWGHFGISVAAVIIGCYVFAAITHLPRRSAPHAVLDEPAKA
jgi:hypothetical protein